MPEKTFCGSSIPIQLKNLQVESYLDQFTDVNAVLQTQQCFIIDPATLTS